jgi:hypothetical protein
MFSELGSFAANKSKLEFDLETLVLLRIKLDDWHCLFDIIKLKD